MAAVGAIVGFDCESAVGRKVSNTVGVAIVNVGDSVGDAVMSGSTEGYVVSFEITEGVPV